MIEKSWTFEKKNRLNFKLKHRKVQKSILLGTFGDLYGRAGDQYKIRETPAKFRRVCTA